MISYKLGGIPYYLGYIRGDLSLAQNLDELFFSDRPILEGEYDRLFNSIFSNPNKIKKIIEFLYTRNYGYSRKEISEGTGIPSGSELTGFLNAMVASDFVSKYISFGKGKRDERYRLTDPFCLFYLHFIHGKNRKGTNFWQNNLNSSSLNSWREIAFENVSFQHVRQIKKALHVEGVESNQAAWIQAGDSDNTGVQIDLIIERADNVVNLCEMKFYSEPFSVDSAYELKIRHRNNLVMNLIPKKKTLRNTLVTTYGIKKNEHSGIFTNVVTLDDLFQ